jgi:site-specific recombinase XerD
MSERLRGSNDLRNSEEGIMSPKSKTRPDPEIKYLDQEAVDRFFRAIPKNNLRDRVLFGLIYRFGLRASEVCQLPESALDRRRWEITIQGLKNGLRRTYTVPRDLQGLLRRWRPASPSLLSGRQGGLTRVRVWQLFKRYAAEADLPPEYSVHALRHSMAVHALDAGLATEDVRDLLRHRKLSTTDVYANLSTRRRADYLARLERSGAVVRVR